MKKACWNCEYYRYNKATGEVSCRKGKKMSKYNFDVLLSDNKPHCPNWAKYDDYREGLYE